MFLSKGSRKLIFDSGVNHWWTEAVLQYIYVACLLLFIGDGKLRTRQRTHESTQDWIQAHSDTSNHLNHQKYLQCLVVHTSLLQIEGVSDFPFSCVKRDWEGSSPGDSGDNLNQTHTGETGLFVSSTQHCLVCNNDQQITSTMCVSKPLHACVHMYLLCGLRVSWGTFSTPVTPYSSTGSPACLPTHTHSGTQTHHSFREFYEVSMGRERTIRTLKAQWVTSLALWLQWTGLKYYFSNVKRWWWRRITGNFYFFAQLTN